MDELNKNQLILLALLVSFVTSIAASIGTASLLEQAPSKVTQTIHRVVERTVETVVPKDNSDRSSGTTQEKTVIVREEDAITEAIANAAPSIVRLYLMKEDVERLERDKEEPIVRFRSLAVATDDEGGLVTPSVLVSGESFDTYEARLSDGTVATAEVQERRSETGVTVLLLSLPVDATLPAAAEFDSGENIKLGQTLLGIGGENDASVSIGIVSNIVRDEEEKVVSVEASFPSDVPGMPVMNLFGEVVGFSKNAGSTTFVSSRRVVSTLDES